MKPEANRLRIGQLAKMTGVSPATIKHYVKEGLLPAPLKTSPNMAYYDVSCVERINVIKRIQKEKFLPLQVIKRLIDAGDSYEEELALGKAILKSHKKPLPGRTVKGSQLVRAAGYPLEKIKLLENDGLILPVIRNNVHYYDELDLEIIALVKQREELGLPFHLSLEVIRVYREAIAHAVNEDIRLFIQNFLGDVPTRTAIQFLTSADDVLDRLLILFRYRMLRSISENAFQEMADLPDRLALLNIFPVEGRELPPGPPEKPLQRTFYFLCRGDYEAATRPGPDKTAGPDLSALAILAALLDGDSSQALKIVSRLIPKPTTRILDNTIAALAYLFSIERATGLSTPMYHTKRAIDYLKHNETARATNPLIAAFSQYVTGAVYTLLPQVVETRGKGVTQLEKLKARINRRRVPTTRLPKWLVRTLDFEIFPALQIRINRFLAQAYSGQGDPVRAAECLERIIELADPDSEHAAWAQMKRLWKT
jgi:DNA-binding transcriptional MerR regulator